MKLDLEVKGPVRYCPFNQTRVELKRASLTEALENQAAFNQTRVELKQETDSPMASNADFF